MASTTIPAMYWVRFYVIVIIWYNNSLIFSWDKIHMIICTCTWEVTNYMHSQGRRGAASSSISSKAPITNIFTLSLTQQTGAGSSLQTTYESVPHLPGCSVKVAHPLDKERSHRLLLSQLLWTCSGLDTGPEGRAPSGREHYSAPLQTDWEGYAGMVVMPPQPRQEHLRWLRQCLEIW